MANYASAFTGGVIFNLSNILLSASVSMAGLTVAFPLGVGIALVLGVFVNYFGEPKGDAVILFSGVALVVLAIIFNAIAAGKMNQKGNSTNKKGIIIAIIAGVLMSFFYRFVAAAMDLNRGFFFNSDIKILLVFLIQIRKSSFRILLLPEICFVHSKWFLHLLPMLSNTG